MEITDYYPKSASRNIKRLMIACGMSAEAAYSMMLMTAALMDLRPEDDEVVELVLTDCGIFPDKIA